MKIFIINSNVKNHYLNIDPKDYSDLFEVYYKTSEGPLGFGQDQISKIIVKEMLLDTVWYSQSTNNFTFITKDFLSQNRLYHANGIFMMPNDFINMEISKEKALETTIKKNALLARYNKTLVQEEPSFFTCFYNKKENKYKYGKISDLFDKKIDILIFHTDSLGEHFIVKQYSLFLKKLLSSARSLGIDVNIVNKYDEIPAW